MEDPTDVAGQQARRREQVERDKVKHQQEADDLKWLMNAKRGRRIAFRMLEKAGVFQLSFNTNAMTMAFNEGRRNQGLEMTRMLMISCPTEWARMIEENAEKDS